MSSRVNIDHAGVQNNPAIPAWLSPDPAELMSRTPLLAYGYVLRMSSGL
jgi:hypothetical protein